jgi:Flp pilus assembly pilin Flp
MPEPTLRATVRRLALRFLAEEHGQDLMEYVLLSAFIGLAGLAALNAIGVIIGTWYGTSNTSVNSLWNSPTPMGS